MGLVNGEGLTVTPGGGAGTGTVEEVSVASDNGFAGTVDTPTVTPVIHIETTVSGIVKGDGQAISAAVAATDYVAPGAVTTSGLTMATDRLLGRDTASSGAIEEIVIGSGLELSGGELVATASGGSVTDVSVASANGFAGSVATSTTTPAISIETTVTGLLEGDGTGVAAASTTGSGEVVRATSPTLVTPALGTPSAVNLSNGTALPIAGIAGLGTGVGTALGQNVTGSGGIMLAASPTTTGTFAAAAITASGTITQTSNSATAFTSGPNGATNPVFTLVNSTASQAAGLSITGAVAAGTVAQTVTSSGANASLSIDAKGNGTLTLQGTATGAITLSRATTLSAALTYGGVTLSNAVTGTGNMVLSASPTLTGTAALASATVAGTIVQTSNSATAFVSGPNGSTNPVFTLVNNTGSQAAGLRVTGAVAAGTVAVDVTSSGANANLSLDGKGSGTITLGGTSTGAITLTRATTLSAALTYGGVTLSNAVTGTGNMVLATSPTLTTPTLGVATATSVSADAYMVSTSSINAQTGTSYTVQNSDNGKFIRCTNAAAIAVSVNTGLTAGFWCEIEQNGAGQVTVGGTATLNSANGLKTRAQYSVLRVRYKGTTDTYNVSGDNTT